MHEYRRRIRTIPGARSCRVCGFQLSPGWVGEACEQEHCRGELDARLSRVRKDFELERAREAAANLKGQELRALRPGEIPGEAVVAVLPGTNRPITLQHPERKTLLRERLSGLIEDADADPDGPTGDPPAPGTPPTAADLLNRAACTACRGQCCRLGEDHAFIRPATLRRFHKGRPEMTGVQVVDAYLECVPKESALGGCVFQGRQGCALPRAMRSDVCNRYLCEDLERAGNLVAGTSKPLLAVCIDGKTPLRTVLIEEGRVRLIDEPPPPPAP
jgi:hypothetical protein